MLKTVLRLDSEPQICMRYLKSFKFFYDAKQHGTYCYAPSAFRFRTLCASADQREGGRQRRWENRAAPVGPAADPNRMPDYTF